MNWNSRNGRRWRWLPMVIITAALILFALSASSTGVAACGSSGSPTVTSDKPDYGTGETAILTGTGFDCGVTLTVKVTRPDGTVVTGDGTETPGSDTVTTDANGEFTYNYQLDGITGEYLVEVIDAGGTVLATTTFMDTHFRYGHISWTPLGGNTIEFTIQNAWRRSAYTTSFGRCVDPSDVNLPSIACTGPGGSAGVGDVIIEFQGGTLFNPGDGSGSIGSPRGPLAYLVTSIDATNDWLFGLALDPNSLPGIDTTISHTYAATGTYVANIDSCCRTTTFDHINNRGTPYRVETNVTVGVGNRSPVSALPPIVQCPIDAICSFFVPGSDADGDTLSWRLSTSFEASGSGFFTQPSGASIDASTGVYTWDTTGATLAFGHPPTFYSTQVMIEDAQGARVAVDFFIQLVEEVGTPPTFTIPNLTCPSVRTDVAGSAISFLVEATDSDPGDLITLNVAGLPPGASMSPALPHTDSSPVSSTFSWTPTAAQAGPHVITFSATDGAGQQALCSITINVVANRPPTVAADDDPVTVGEGETAVNTGTVDDPDGDAVTLSASIGTITNNNDGTWSWSFATNDGPAESQTVTVTADDGNGGTTETSFNLVVNNVVPTVDPPVVPADPVNIDDQPLSASANFSDPAGTADEPYTCTVDYGDGNGPQSGTVSGTTCEGPEYTYAEPGVYLVTVAVTDKDGGTGSATADTFIVIYDPDGGFVTGGGWIWSEAGDCRVDLDPDDDVDCPAAEGKATFGFVSKYKNGAQTPSGNTQFQFHAGDLNFHSDSYDWLVVAGARAQYKGEGTINGMGTYKFRLTAFDAAINDSDSFETDRFRIRIWTEDEGGVETVIYDNGSGDDLDDSGDSGTDELGSGSIVIHSGKGKK